MEESIWWSALADLGFVSQMEDQFEIHRRLGRRAGRVGRVDRDSCLVHLPAPERAALGGLAVATGDWVALDGEGADLRVGAVAPRRSSFVRRAAGAGDRPQVVAANIDWVAVTIGVDNPRGHRALHRYLTATRDGGAEPLVVISKADLVTRETLQAVMAAASPGSAAVVAVSARTGEGLDELRSLGLGRAQTMALVGPSGAGKSTLVNALMGVDLLATGSVRNDGKGRHTTTHRELLVVPSGGIIIDTPGMRELGIWMDRESVAHAFPDLEALAGHCRFRDCAHDLEPGCAVRAAADSGTLAPERLLAWRQLDLEAASLDARRGDLAARQREKLRWKKLSIEQRRQLDESRRRD
ncbi:MAG: ribosome small subunit-dependent GTPase A [Candidatus Dormiibacterota bacterium]